MGEVVNYLDTLLSKIDDQELTSALREEIAKLKDTKQFGLVFEKHLPERVRLYSHPVRRGLTVQFKTETDGPNWVVTKVVKGAASVRQVRGDGKVKSVPASDLVVVRAFGDPIYPGLKSLGSINRGGDRPAHVVINAENYHALETLRYPLEGKVDCIYIDPPYNLGGDLTYNDKRVAKEDSFRHSKWLSFMDRRLRLAKDLLSDTGVIIVAIDDTEQAHLRLLMDQLFVESNFLATVVWQGGRKNDSRYVSVGHDYMLIYAKSEQALSQAGIRWRERKPGLDRVVLAAQEIWAQVAGGKVEARRRMKKWYRQLPEGDPARAMARYSFFNSDGTLARDDNITWPGGGGPMFDVLHPESKKPVPTPVAGWRFSSPGRMQEMIERDEIIFGIDETSPISLKRHLESTEGQVALSVFDRQRTHAGRELIDILGEKRFTHPKDANVLARWIDIATGSKPDALILDFFAGSGSTAQAVMQLNSADGGIRQCVIITNNEVEEKAAKSLGKAGVLQGSSEWEAEGIFNRVTRPRIATIVTGRREDGSAYSDGLTENVEFLELTYEDRDHISLGRAYEAVATLLWMKAGATGPIIGKLPKDEAFSIPDGAVYGVLFDAGNWRRFVTAVHKRSEIRHVFITTDSLAVFQQVLSELPAGVEATMLYEDYLSTFQINTGIGVL